MLLLLILLAQLPLDYGSQQLTAAASDVFTAAADVTADDMSAAVMAANETVVDSTTESLLGRRYQSPYRSILFRVRLRYKYRKIDIYIERNIYRKIDKYKDRYIEKWINRKICI